MYSGEDARIARREEGECREHLTDEQRREAGCIGGRYVAVIVKRSTKHPAGLMTDDHRIADLSDATALVARLERVPFSRWHLRPRLIVGSATFFDAFDA